MKKRNKRKQKAIKLILKIIIMLLAMNFYAYVISDIIYKFLK